MIEQHGTESGWDLFFREEVESMLREAYGAGVDAGLADQGVPGRPPETEDAVVARLLADN